LDSFVEASHQLALIEAMRTVLLIDKTHPLLQSRLQEMAIPARSSGVEAFQT
jgi:hypothetical protein